MSPRKTFARSALVTVLFLSCFGYSQSAISNPDDLKKSMDEVQEAKYDLDDALTAKNSVNALKASSKLAELLEEDARYWRTKKIEDAIALADTSISQSKAVSQRIEQSDFSGAQTVATQLQNSCRSCHDAHPEKRAR